MLLWGKIMRSVKLISLFLLLLSSQSSLAQAWIEYVDEAERFIVNFPGEPVVEEIGYLTQSGATMPGRVYTVENPPSRYVVTVVNYTEAERNLEEHCAQRTDGEACDGNEAGTDVRGAVPFAAWNIRRQGGELIYDAYHEIDGIQGLQLQVIEADNSQSFAGIYMHARRLYILEGRRSGGFPSTAALSAIVGNSRRRRRTGKFPIRRE